jgi:hypothetical protein
MNLSDPLPLDKTQASNVNTFSRTVKPVIQPCVHEVRLRNQIMYLDPPVEFSRESLFLQLHAWIGTVSN